ncbi:DUF6503 family protein [Aquimarina agarilytica]|uniref:DUF6503 family protein n=1 Tax=Aquimarina agarilytica TaxID=1087449 RepID=UPI000288C037|nr:DUF6503 family protein [Aquimarina agarilytica]
MKKHLIISAVTMLFSCQKQQKKHITPTESTIEIVKEVKKISPFTQKIELTHKKEAYLNHKAISFDINVKFGGKDYLSGTLTQLTNGTKIRLDNKNTTKVIYNGDDVFICPKTAEIGGSRFDIFTWSYFFNLPYKLNDPGTIWSTPTKKPLNGSLHQTEKLSFETGIGDAPDDWYIVYKNAIDNTLAGAAYIVSFGKDLAAAEKEPHSIKFNNYQNVDGIPISKKWTFHNWNEKDGYGDQIGEATISNVKFLDVDNALFAKPEDSKPVLAP